MFSRTNNLLCSALFVIAVVFAVSGSDLTFFEVKSNFFKVTWTPPAGFTGTYYARLYDENMTEMMAFFASLSTTFIPYFNLQPVKNYTVSIGDQPPTFSPLIGSTYTTPEAPVNLTIADVTTNGFIVSWKKGNIRAEEFNVTLEDQNGDMSSIAIPITSFTYNSLTPGTGYNVSVRTVVYINGNPLLSYDSLRAEQYTVPSAPTSLSFSSVTHDGFTVSWVPGAGDADQYRVVMKYTNNTQISENFVSDTSFAYTSLAPETNYVLEVTALAGRVDSFLESASFTGSQLTEEWVKPTIEFTEVTSTSIKAAWDRPSGFDGTYQVILSDANGTELVRFSASLGTSFIPFMNLKPIHQYFVTVTSIPEAFVPIEGDTYTTPVGPVDLVISTVTTQDFAVSWDQGAGVADGYEVTLEKDGDIMSANTVTEKFFQFSGLTSGTGYEVVVRTVVSVEGQTLKSYDALEAEVFTKPQVPDSLVFSAVSTVGFLATWKGSGNVDQYRVTLTGSDGSQVTSMTTEPSIFYNTLAPDTTYALTVTAVVFNSSGQQIESDGGVTGTQVTGNVIDTDTKPKGTVIKHEKEEEEIVECEDEEIDKSQPDQWMHLHLIGTDIGRWLTCCNPEGGSTVATYPSSSYALIATNLDTDIVDDFYMTITPNMRDWVFPLSEWCSIKLYHMKLYNWEGDEEPLKSQMYVSPEEASVIHACNSHAFSVEEGPNAGYHSALGQSDALYYYFIPMIPRLFEGLVEVESNEYSFSWKYNHTLFDYPVYTSGIHSCEVSHYNRENACLDDIYMTTLGSSKNEITYYEHEEIEVSFLARKEGVCDGYVVSVGQDHAGVYTLRENTITSNNDLWCQDDFMFNATDISFNLPLENVFLGQIRFASFSLPLGRLLFIARLEARSVYSAEDTYYRVLEGLFTIVPSPVRAVIKGPTLGYHQDTLPLILDASESRDLAKLTHSTSDLKYQWVCKMTNSPDDDCFTSGGIDYKGIQLVIPEDLFSVWTRYTFFLDVTSASDSSRNSTARLSVTIIDYYPFTIRCVSNCNKHNPFQRLAMEAGCDIMDDLADIDFHWHLYNITDGIFEDVSHRLAHITFDRKDGQKSSLLKIDRMSLGWRNTFIFMVNGTHRINEIRAHGRYEVSVLSEYDLPLFGDCYIIPPSGFAIYTTFHIMCEGFTTLVLLEYNLTMADTLVYFDLTAPTLVKLPMRPDHPGGLVHFALNVTDFLHLYSQDYDLSVEIYSRSGDLLQDLQSYKQEPALQDLKLEVQAMDMVRLMYDWCYLEYLEDPHRMVVLDSISKELETRASSVPSVEIVTPEDIRGSLNFILSVTDKELSVEAEASMSNMLGSVVNTLEILTTDMGEIMPATDTAELLGDALRAHVLNMGESVRVSEGAVLQEEKNISQVAELNRNYSKSFKKLLDICLEPMAYAALTDETDRFAVGGQSVAFTVNKMTVEEFSNLTIQGRQEIFTAWRDNSTHFEEGLVFQESEITLPSAGVLGEAVPEFKDLESSFLVETLVTEGNPYLWGGRGSDVKTAIMEVNIKNSSGCPVTVQALRKPVEIKLYTKDLLRQNVSHYFNLNIPSRINEEIQIGIWRFVLKPVPGNLTIVYLEPSQENLTLYLYPLKGEHIELVNIYSESLQLIMNHSIRIPHSDDSYYRGLKKHQYAVYLEPGDKYKAYYALIGILKMNTSTALPAEIEYTLNVTTYSVECLHWNSTAEEWMSSGCKVSEYSSMDILFCQCDHMTAYGGGIEPVKVDIHPVDPVFLIPMTLALFFYCCVSLLYWAWWKDQSSKYQMYFHPVEGNSLKHDQRYLICLHRDFLVSSEQTCLSFAIIGTLSASRFVPFTVQSLPSVWSRLCKGELLKEMESWYIITTPICLGDLKKIKFAYGTTWKFLWRSQVKCIEIVDSRSRKSWLFILDKSNQVEDSGSDPELHYLGSYSFASPESVVHKERISFASPDGVIHKGRVSFASPEGHVSSGHSVRASQSYMDLRTRHHSKCLASLYSSPSQAVYADHVCVQTLYSSPSKKMSGHVCMPASDRGDARDANGGWSYSRSADQSSHVHKSIFYASTGDSSPRKQTTVWNLPRSTHQSGKGHFCMSNLYRTSSLPTLLVPSADTTVKRKEGMQSDHAGSHVCMPGLTSIPWQEPSFESEPPVPSSPTMPIKMDLAYASQQAVVKLRQLAYEAGQTLKELRKSDYEKQQTSADAKRSAFNLKPKMTELIKSSEKPCSTSVDSRKSTYASKQAEMRKSAFESQQTLMEKRRSSYESVSKPVEMRRSAYDSRQTPMEVRKSAYESLQTSSEKRQSLYDSRHAPIKVPVDDKSCQASIHDSEDEAQQNTVEAAQLSDHTGQESISSERLLPVSENACTTPTVSSHSLSESSSRKTAEDSHLMPARRKLFPTPVPQPSPCSSNTVSKRSLDFSASTKTDCSSQSGPSSNTRSGDASRDDGECGTSTSATTMSRSGARGGLESASRTSATSSQEKASGIELTTTAGISQNMNMNTSASTYTTDTSGTDDHDSFDESDRESGSAYEIEAAENVNENQSTIKPILRRSTFYEDQSTTEPEIISEGSLDEDDSAEESLSGSCDDSNSDLLLVPWLNIAPTSRSMTCCTDLFAALWLWTGIINFNLWTSVWFQTTPRKYLSCFQQAVSVVFCIMVLVCTVIWMDHLQLNLGFWIPCVVLFGFQIPINVILDFIAACVMSFLSLVLILVHMSLVCHYRKLVYADLGGNNRFIDYTTDGKPLPKKLEKKRSHGLSVLVFQSVLLYLTYVAVGFTFYTSLFYDTETNLQKFLDLIVTLGASIVVMENVKILLVTFVMGFCWLQIYPRYGWHSAAAPP